MTRHHALPQNLHVLPKGGRSLRLCGSPVGGYIRERDLADYLPGFLAKGGGLCPECKKRLPPELVEPPKRTRRRTARAEAI